MIVNFQFFWNGHFAFMHVENECFLSYKILKECRMHSIHFTLPSKKKCNFNYESPKMRVYAQGKALILNQISNQSELFLHICLYQIYFQSSKNVNKTVFFLGTESKTQTIGNVSHKID